MYPKRQEQEELSSPMPTPTLALKLSCLPDIPPEATKTLRGAFAARGKRHTVGMAHWVGRCGTFTQQRVGVRRA